MKMILLLFKILILNAIICLQVLAQDTPACLSFRGCLHLSLRPRTFGLPPLGDCHLHLELESSIPEIEKPSSNQPSTGKLIVFGLGLAPLEFFVSTALHEGSHAVGIIGLKDADLTAFKPWPHKTDSGNFVFGATYWQGNLTPKENALVTVAPMITDTIILGGYSALTATGNVPENKYARLGLWVFAAGHWVDMANHLAARNEFTDSNKLIQYFETEHGMSHTESSALVKGAQGAVLVTSGYFMAKELYHIFKDGPAPVRELSSDGHTKPKPAKAFDFQDIYVLPQADGTQAGLVLGGHF